MYLRRVPRKKVPQYLASAVGRCEAAGHVFGPHFYFAEPLAGDGSSSGPGPVYAHATLGERDLLVRLEEAVERHAEPHVDVVDLGEGGLDGRPVYVALREAIYDDKFDS